MTQVEWLAVFVLFGRDICNWMYNISKQQLRIRADEWPKERGVGDRSQGTMVILITSSQGEELGELMQLHCKVLAPAMEKDRDGRTEHSTIEMRLRHKPVPEGDTAGHMRTAAALPAGVSEGKAKSWLGKYRVLDTCTVREGRLSLPA